MLVQILHCPPRTLSDHSANLLHAWGQALEATGIDVRVDSIGESSERAPSVAKAAAELSRQWAAGLQPDVIHTFGAIATAAAIQAKPAARILATFHEEPVPTEPEMTLATQVHAVVSLSSQEHDRWEHDGVRSLMSGPLPVATVDPDQNACADPRGDVVTMCSGADLDELLDSMRYWHGRLIVLADPGRCRKADIRRMVAERGQADRVVLRSSGTARERAQVWRNAAVLYAGAEGSQHAAAVLEAAAHGVPSLAVTMGAHRDCVVSGTTGLLLAPRPHRAGGAGDHWNPGPALAALLAEPFWIRALGTAALVRVGSAHAPATAGAQLGELYATAVACETAEDRPTVTCAERDQLVTEHMGLARQLASWYAGRGQSMDDLIQVASLGLVNAARRFDPSHGREFHSFAIPTILGELRRHFRDNAWAVRVPRGLQETTLQVQRAAEALSQSYGRPPTVAELAEHLDVVEEDVRLALQTEGEARSARSLDVPLDSDSFAGLLGDDEQALETVELRQDVRAAIAKLPEREQQILLLRFYGERTQAEIAAVLGISQVHVSRVLSRTLAGIRDYVLDDVPMTIA